MRRKTQDIHKNYDYVWKEALILYMSKILEFLELHDIAPIAEPLRTENTQIDIKSELADLTFALADGRGINFEEEVKLSKDDLLRFAGYNIWLSREYGRELITVVLVKQTVTISELKTEQLHFKPFIVDCSKIDADALLEKLKNNIRDGKEINELELIYLPLFAS